MQNFSMMFVYIRGVQGKGVKRSRPAVCVVANPAEKKKPLSLVAFVVLWSVEVCLCPPLLLQLPVIDKLLAD